MERKKVFVAISIVTVILLAVVGYWWIVARPAWQLEKVQQMQAEIFRPEIRELPDEERRERIRQYRDAYEKLSESQQRQLRSERSKSMRGRMTEQISTYFELPVGQRAAFLDKQIREMEKRRREFAKRGREATRGPRGAGRGGPPGVGRGRGNNKETSTKEDRRERRDRFKRGFLDGTTPQERAEMAAYMAALRDRREELGLPDRGRSGFRRRESKA